MGEGFVAVERALRPLHVGDIVVRRNRLLRTHGTVIEVKKMTRNDIRLLWIRWAHATTLPNPSLEREDSLDRPVLAARP